MKNVSKEDREEMMKDMLEVQKRLWKTYKPKGSIDVLIAVSPDEECEEPNNKGEQ